NRRRHKRCWPSKPPRGPSRRPAATASASHRRKPRPGRRAPSTAKVARRPDRPGRKAACSAFSRHPQPRTVPPVSAEGYGALAHACFPLPLEGGGRRRFGRRVGVMSPPAPCSTEVSLWRQHPHPSTLRVADLPPQGGGDE